MILGIDTSNYTTSAALYDAQGRVFQQKLLLPVRDGGLGLRQSDAVFHHVQQLPLVMRQLFDQCPGARVSSIGVSTRPRSQEGSYMPCFTVGKGAAEQLSAVLRVPLHSFSHQEGHIASALYSADRLALLKERFLAFHVSGGTTEAVLVEPGGDSLFSVRKVASSLDLKAGQAVDRVGLLLGLTFPCGKELERLALQAARTFSVRPSMKGADCSLSGVENKCRAMLEKGEPKEDVARFCLCSILAALDGMTAALQKEFGALPLLFAGGVCSNSLLRDALSEKYGAVFAQPEFSTDNAAGAAILAELLEEKKGGTARA